MSKPESAGFIIFRQAGQSRVEYLLLQASTHGRNWTPPKGNILGHLERDESPLQAAQRETKEEAGLDQHDLEYYDKFEEKITYNVNGRPKDVFYYLARLQNYEQNIKLSDEHQNLAWANLQEAHDLVQRAEMNSALSKADEFIKK